MLTFCYVAYLFTITEVAMFEIRNDDLQENLEHTASLHIKINMLTFIHVLCSFVNIKPHFGAILNLTLSMLGFS